MYYYLNYLMTEYYVRCFFDEISFEKFYHCNVRKQKESIIAKKHTW